MRLSALLEFAAAVVASTTGKAAPLPAPAKMYQTKLAANQSATCTVCNKIKLANQMRVSERNLCLECNCYSQYKRAYTAGRYATEEHFRLSILLRGRVLSALTGSDESQRTMDLVGCTITKFRQHIMQHFTTRMTWETGDCGTWIINGLVMLGI